MPDTACCQLYTTLVREGLSMADQSHIYTIYDVRAKLKNMAARGVLDEIRVNGNTTAWAVRHDKNQNAAQ